LRTFEWSVGVGRGIEPVEAADSELRSVSFFQRSPMSGRRLETFRSVVDEGGMGHVWVQNQGTVTGLDRARGARIHGPPRRTRPESDE
jgi:hypothetical protein